MYRKNYCQPLGGTQLERENAQMPHHLVRRIDLSVYDIPTNIGTFDSAFEDVAERLFFRFPTLYTNNQRTTLTEQ